MLENSWDLQIHKLVNLRVNSTVVDLGGTFGVIKDQKSDKHPHQTF